MDKVLMPKELTAENGAKKLLIGEFKEVIELTCPQCFSMPDTEKENCDLCRGAGNIYNAVTIEWTTIKAIYAMAVKNLGEST